MLKKLSDIDDDVFILHQKMKNNMKKHKISNIKQIHVKYSINWNIEMQ